MKGKHVRLLALVVAAGLAACGDSTDVLDELSEEEAAELASAVVFTTFSNTGSVPQGQPGAVGGPQQAPFALSFDLDFVAECPLGGGVAIDASLDVEGDTESDAGTVDYEMTQVHDGCRVESDDGLLFTLDGAPAVTVSLMAENDGQGNVSWSGSLVGSVAWETDARAGVCSLELEFSGSGNETAETGEFSLAGSACARELDLSGSIG